MKSLSIFAILASPIFAHPIIKRADIDATILQFALTLEHLENVFYKGALEKFPEQAFLDAGYSATYYSNLKYIAHDEEQHVELLEQGLIAAGAKPVQACKYHFPYTDVKSFVSLSSVLEGVGTSAYLGAAPLVTSKEYLTIAGSILVTEALHTSMQRAAVGLVPQANPYGTPLSPMPVYTLAASFIESCPSTNINLGFTAYPALTAVQGEPTSPGIPFLFSVTGDIAASSFVTFISGLNITSVAVTDLVTAAGVTKFSAVVPESDAGQAYALVTNTDVSGGPIAADAILFGPAILEVTPNSPTYNVTEA